jgi:hypothetical protein
VLEALLRFGEIAPASGAVVGAQIFSDLLVPNAIHSREDRLACDHAPLALLQDSPGLFLVVGAGALADRSPARVVLHPPDAPWGAVPSLLLVDRPHCISLKVRQPETMLC